jgi:ectoine hydrolase
MPDHINLPFERTEYASRLARTRAAMDARGIDVLIVTDPTNMNWLTGYDGWSFYVHQCVIVGPEGEPVWFGRGQDANGARRTAWIAEANIVGYPDHYVQSTERHPLDYLASELIAARGWAGKRIGVELDNYYFSAAAYLSLAKNLPQASLVDATALVNWQRAVKSPREIEYMRIAAKIVERMHQTIVDTIEPGMRKNELVARIYAAGIEGADGHGGDYPATAATTAHSRAPSSSAVRPSTSSRPKRPWSRAFTPASTLPARATPANTSPTPSSRCCRVTASRRTAAAATRSARATRPTGANAP